MERYTKKIDNEKMSNNNKFINYLRGIAAVLVIVGHCIEYGNGKIYLENQAAYDCIVFKIIYSFHMPLFGLLSGYTLYYSLCKRERSEIVFRKIYHLLIPIFAWQTIWYFCDVVINRKCISFLGWMNSCFNGLWFLWGIFFCSIIVVAFCNHIWILFLMYLLFFFIPDVGNFALYIYIYPFFIIGYLLHKAEKENLSAYNIQKIKTIKKTKFLFASFLVGLYFSLLQIFDKSSYIYFSRYCLFPENIIEHFKIDIYRMIIGFVGCSIVIGIAYLLRKNSSFYALNSIVEKIGQESMGLYIISGYSLSILKGLTVSFTDNFLVILIESIFTLSFSYFFTYWLKKNLIFRKLLFGK